MLTAGCGRLSSRSHGSIISASVSAEPLFIPLFFLIYFICLSGRGSAVELFCWQFFWGDTEYSVLKWHHIDWFCLRATLLGRWLQPAVITAACHWSPRSVWPLTSDPWLPKTRNFPPNKWPYWILALVGPSSVNSYGCDAVKISVCHTIYLIIFTTFITSFLS